MAPERITILTAEELGHDEANRYGIRFVIEPLTRGNYRTVLDPLLGPGDFLLNLSVDVSSVALIEFCQERGALYLDTCIEPWPGGYTDPDLTPSQRSNYALQGERARSAHALSRRPDGGAHPRRQPRHRLAFRQGSAAGHRPRYRRRCRRAEQSAGMGKRSLTRLGVKVIHIAERDTQVAGQQPKRVGEFVNTWSIDGFVGEGCQPAELGWGTHERHFPEDGRAPRFRLRRRDLPGTARRRHARSHLDAAGGPVPRLPRHPQRVDLDRRLLHGAQRRTALAYRPTVHYAYHPCDDAVLSLHELAGKNWRLQPEKRLMMDEITSGIDELGVLLMGHAKGAYWYGSRLSVDETRRLVPYNNATSLQVTAAVLAGMVWAIENPRAGIVEADDIDHVRCMQIARPYLGEVVGVYSDWTPLVGRGELFPESLDPSCPWQFKNFRVL